MFTLLIGSKPRATIMYESSHQITNEDTSPGNAEAKGAKQEESKKGRKEEEAEEEK